MNSSPEPLLDPSALSKYVGIPVGTLYQWNHRGEGPPAIKVGRHLRYRMSDVERWLDAQKRQMVS